VFFFFFLNNELFKVWLELQSQPYKVIIKIRM